MLSLRQFELQDFSLVPNLVRKGLFIVIAGELLTMAKGFTATAGERTIIAEELTVIASDVALHSWGSRRYRRGASSPL